MPRFAVPPAAGAGPGPAPARVAEYLELLLEDAAAIEYERPLIRRTAGEAENRVRGELLAELLSTGHRDPDGLRERSRRLGTGLDRAHAVVVARVEEARHRPRALASATGTGRHRGAPWRSSSCCGSTG